MMATPMNETRRPAVRCMLAALAVGAIGCAAWTAGGYAQTSRPALRLTPIGNSPASNHAALEILAPRAGEVLPAGAPVMLQLDVSGFELGAATAGTGQNGLASTDGGQHIHVIVDNGAYKAVYSDAEPFDLGALEPGVHTIEAFASRSWHEGVKSPRARKMVTFYVGEQTGEPPVRPGAPLLSYSRPKGEYAGAGAESIMVDFYLTNASLGPNDYRVRVTVDGQSAVVDSWQPYKVDGLAEGEHTFAVQLLDPMGEPVPGAYNNTSRTITIKP